MTTKHNARFSKLLSKQREISGYFLECVFFKVVGSILSVISVFSTDIL